MTTQTPQSQTNDNGNNGAPEEKITVAQRRMKTLKEYLGDHTGAIQKMLPKHLTAERLTKITTSAASRTPDLLECTPASILVALIDCGTLGLEPNTPMGLAYLIPFRNNDKGGRFECQLIVGYKGYIQLAHWSGEVGAVWAHEVCEKDFCKVKLGSAKIIEHELPMIGERGKEIGFYACVKYLHGTVDFAYLSKLEVDQVRAKAPGKNSKAWVESYNEMAKKTAVRRLMKLVPMSPEKPLARALAVEDAHETGTRSSGELNDLGFLDDREIVEAPVDDPTPTASRGDALADKLGGSKAS